jgi:antitoxin CptB
MDLIMGRFADAFIESLAAADLDVFENLLEVPDPDLYGWISGERAIPADVDTPVLRRLRDFSRRAGAR